MRADGAGRAPRKLINKDISDERWSMTYANYDHGDGERLLPIRWSAAFVRCMVDDGNPDRGTRP